MTKRHLYGRNIILILAASFFYIASAMFINPLITGFAKGIGGSTLMAGIVAGIMNITSLFLRPISGQLTDKFSKKRLASVGGLGLLIATIGYTVVNNTAWLLFFRVVNGVGYVLCTVCMATWMASLLPRDKIGSGMGIYGLMNALGMAIAPALSIALYQRLGYRKAFIAAVVCSVLMILLVQLVGDEGAPQAPQKTGKSAHQLRIVQPKVFPLAMMLMLFAIPYFATQAYIVSYVETLHLNVAVGAFFPIYAAFLIILRLSLRSLFDTVAFGKFLYVSLLSTVIGLLALTHLTNDLWLGVAALGIAGGYGLMFSICQATALLIVPESEQGLANSTFYIGMDLGMSMGPMIGGLLKSVFPLHLFYPIMLVTLPVIWLIYFMNRRSLNSAVAR